ncbi:unnamed protein product [Caenorhabditis bovis]|uniref:Uncharacterized protein n=1 Tax=Caenorhabditis bovis TaxID=2654633 RepID=A0A8S1FCQ1_9PELO|nr:unnamed protein product [Caenorhabditis bovis]
MFSELELRERKRKKEIQNKRKCEQLSKASPRVIWESKLDYVLTVISLTIGIGNIITFPAKCYKHGGFTFLFVYLLLLLTFGVPFLYLELIMGQYHRCTPTILFRRSAPALQGAGWISLISAVFTTIPYMLEVAFVFKTMFVFSAIGHEDKVWTNCNNSWNSDLCYLYNDQIDGVKYHEHSDCRFTKLSSINDIKSIQPNFQFQIVAIQQRTESFMEFGSVNSNTLLVVTFLWVIVALIHNRGIAYLGSFAAISVIITYLIIPTLLFRAFGLIWIDALTQVTFSLGLGFGGHVTLSSFSQPKQNTFGVVCLNVFLDTLLSLVAATTVFCALGHTAHALGTSDIFDLVPTSETMRVSFFAFPIVIEQMPDIWFWSVMFYSSVGIIGFSTITIMILSISVPIADVLNIPTKSYKHDLIALGLIFITWLINIFFSMGSGIYWITMFSDISHFCQGISIFTNSVILGYFYGADNIIDDVNILMGNAHNLFSKYFGYQSPVWYYSWKYYCPVVSLLFSVIAFVRQFPSPNDDIRYPYLYDTFQITLTTMVIMLMPLGFIYTYVTFRVYFEDFEPDKEFTFEMLFSKQKQLRSWRRISTNLLCDDKIEYSRIMQILPEMEPGDPNGTLRALYTQFFLVAQNPLFMNEKRKATEKKKKKKRKKTKLHFWSKNFDDFGDDNREIDRKEKQRKTDLLRKLKLEKLSKASPRVIWDEQIDYLLSCISFTIGIGNIVSFPARCYKHGGFTFLIAYFITMLTFGVPILYMEIIMGQYHRCTPIITFRRCAPALQGAGWLALVSSLFLTIPYMMDVALIVKSMFIYSIVGLKGKAWSKCDNHWNDEICFDPLVSKSEEALQCYYTSLYHINSTIRNVIDESSDSFMDFNEINSKTFLVVTFLWLMVALIHNRGIAKMGGFAAISVILVYLFIPTLFIRSIGLEGSELGLAKLFGNFDLESLASTSLWLDALAQVAFSLGVGFGGHVVLASFAPPKQNTFGVVMCVIFLDAFLSLVSAATMFAALGHRANHLRIENIFEVVPTTEVNRVTFYAIPIVIERMPDIWFWVVMFYLCLALIGFSTICLIVLAISVPITDSLNIPTKSYKHDVIALIAVLCLWLTNTLMSLKSGIYWMSMFNDISHFSQGFTILIMVIIMSCYYGADNIMDDLKILMGKPKNVFSRYFGFASPIWQFLWKFYCPVIAFTIQIMLTIGIICLLPLGFLYSYVSFLVYFQDYEPSKIFTWDVLFLKQKQLRSWRRISGKMLEDDAHAFEEIMRILPDREPDDPDGILKALYKQFFYMAQSLVSFCL